MTSINSPGPHSVVTSSTSTGMAERWPRVVLAAARAPGGVATVEEGGYFGQGCMDGSDYHYEFSARALTYTDLRRQVAYLAAHLRGSAAKHQGGKEEQTSY